VNSTPAARLARQCESQFIVTIVHPQKDVPVGRAVDTVKKIGLEIK
jgi:hypothetical protein